VHARHGRGPRPKFGAVSVFVLQALVRGGKKKKRPLPGCNAMCAKFFAAPRRFGAIGWEFPKSLGNLPGSPRRGSWGVIHPSNHRALSPNASVVAAAVEHGWV